MAEGKAQICITFLRISGSQDGVHKGPSRKVNDSVSVQRQKEWDGSDRLMQRLEKVLGVKP